MLLSAPQVLDSSPYKWLHEMLEVFNSGDLHAYDALCTKYASVLNGQPALVEHERRLREKVREGEGRRGGVCMLTRLQTHIVVQCVLTRLQTHVIVQNSWSPPKIRELQ